jgi:hypothetical protein
LLVRKYINVMVGIIRNKIIISDRYLYPSGWFGNSKGF